MQKESIHHVLVRDAKPADAEAIIQVHDAAVQETASPLYPSEMEHWSQTPAELRCQQMRQTITRDGQVVMVVAEDQSGILGFGLVKFHELRALYVHPKAGRRGIGSKILQELEKRALHQGISCLQLIASLNAESFYQRNGYQILSRGTIPLSGEHKIDCVKMQKTL